MLAAEKSHRAAAVRYPVWLNRQGARVGLDEDEMPGSEAFHAASRAPGRALIL